MWALHQITRSSKQSGLPLKTWMVIHPMTLQGISLHAAFISGPHPTPVLHKLPRHCTSKAPTCINRGTQGRWKKEVKKVAGPSWDAIKLMRFPEFLWIEPDAKYITSNKLTSNYWCGAPLPDVQQMEAGATKGVSTQRFVLFRSKKKTHTAVRLCVCFKSPWAEGWRWREGQEGREKMKAHH